MSVSAQKWLVDRGHEILGFGFQEWVLGMSVRVSIFCPFVSESKFCCLSFVPVLVEMFIRLSACPLLP